MRILKILLGALLLCSCPEFVQTAQAADSRSLVAYRPEAFDLTTVSWVDVAARDLSSRLEALKEELVSLASNTTNADRLRGWQPDEIVAKRAAVGMFLGSGNRARGTQIITELQALITEQARLVGARTRVAHEAALADEVLQRQQEVLRKDVEGRAASFLTRLVARLSIFTSAKEDATEALKKETGRTVAIDALSEKAFFKAQLKEKKDILERGVAAVDSAEEQMNRIKGEINLMGEALRSSVDIIPAQRLAAMSREIEENTARVDEIDRITGEVIA